MWLSGDIGGTKSLLQLQVVQRGESCHRESFASADFADFSALMAHFLQRSRAVIEDVHFVCLGVAGPVIDQCCHITNLPWVIDAAELKARFGFREVILINDLQASALGVIELDRMQDLKCLQRGKPQTQSPVLVCSLGTGFGVSFLLGSGHDYRAYPTEGGHVDFAPKNPQQQRLLNYAWLQHASLSYEQLLSGAGLLLLYRFCCAETQVTPFDGVSPSDVTQWSQQQSNVQAVASMALFGHILATHLGHLALQFLPRGGIYLAGGITPKILPFLRQKTFLQTLNNQGNMSHLMADFPIFAVVNEYLGLLGASAHAYGMINNDD
jgi:glucokinase